MREWLRNARLEKGYTQEELAKLCGVSSKTISAYETGRRGKRISLQHLYTFQEVLNIGNLQNIVSEELRSIVSR